jgi:hypothetical protein
MPYYTLTAEIPITYRGGYVILLLCYNNLSSLYVSLIKILSLWRVWIYTTTYQMTC